jgi:excisionase family DNA binding protein
MTITTKQQRRARFGPSEWIGVDEAANIRNCSRWKIYELIKTGQLDSWLDGGSRKIRRSSVEKTPEQFESFTPPTVA